MLDQPYVPQLDEEWQETETPLIEEEEEEAGAVAGSQRARARS